MSAPENSKGSAPSRDQVDQENDHSDYQQDVNEAAQRVGTDQAQQPKNQQNDEDCPKHSSLQFGERINPAFADTLIQLTGGELCQGADSMKRDV